MSNETINTIFTIEGLLLLATYLVGNNNHELWMYGSFYVLIPLTAIVTIVSFFSLFSKRAYNARRGKRFLFFVFNLFVTLGLSAFVWWAIGGNL